MKFTSYSNSNSSIETPLYTIRCGQTIVFFFWLLSLEIGEHQNFISGLVFQCIDCGLVQYRSLFIYSFNKDEFCRDSSYTTTKF